MAMVPDLSGLSHAQKATLIAALVAKVEALTARGAEWEAKLGGRRRRPTILACRHRRGRSLQRLPPPSRKRKPMLARTVRRRGPRRVRAGDQRGRARRHPRRQPTGVRRAEEPDQGAAAFGNGAGLRLGRRSRRQGESLAVGVPSRPARRVRRRSASHENRRERLPRRLAAAVLGLRPPRQPERLVEARPSGLPGASDPRRPICRRRRRRDLRPLA